MINDFYEQPRQGVMTSTDTNNSFKMTQSKTAEEILKKHLELGNGIYIKLQGGDEARVVRAMNDFASQEVRRALVDVVKELNTFAIKDIELPIAKIQSKIDELE